MKRNVFHSGLRAFLCVAISISLSRVATLAQASSQSAVATAGGTVNIFLASGDKLVAVTDSMLTYGPDHHVPEGIKLYKIDDQTICTMAGLYFQGFPDVNSLALRFPEMMSQSEAFYGNRSSGQLSFDYKAMHLFTSIRFQMTSHLQALAAAGQLPDLSDPNLSIEVTMAGYDLDGSLKVAETMLAPRKVKYGVAYLFAERPISANPPLCELTAATRPLELRNREEGDVLPVIKIVKDKLFCEVAGIPEMAEAVLNYPQIAQRNLAIKPYILMRDTGLQMSLDEMRDLAIELDRQTEIREKNTGLRRVGGAPQIAVLDSGKVTEMTTQAPPVDKSVGSRLLENHFLNIISDCNGGSFVEGGGGGQLQVNLKNCVQSIDHFIFHDSKFTDSELTLASTEEPVLFATSNIVENSTLKLGPKVDSNRKDVRSLICGFHWKAVYQDSKPLSINCDVKK